MIFTKFFKKIVFRKGVINVSSNKTKNIFIYFNYLVSFLGSIFFLVGANYLDLINIDKYIFLISISTIFASSIYASSIKSKLKGSVIMIDFTKNSLKSLSREITP